MSSKIKHLWKTVNPAGIEFKTFVINFPKPLLAELNTHRILVRNTGSSRAIPTPKLIANIEENPYIPHFTGLQKGMQGTELEKEDLEKATNWWSQLRQVLISQVAACPVALHKQNINRVLEPMMNVDVVLSGTDWSNFYALRAHPDAQPDFAAIAYEMKALDEQTEATPINYWDWHMPFPVEEGVSSLDRLYHAVANCARVSYLNHEGEVCLEKDKGLYETLLQSRHMTPFEHLAISVPTEDSAILRIEQLPYKTFELPPQLKERLFLHKATESLLFTRQYRGFYTLRSMIEDGLEAQFLSSL